jgi:ribosome-associated translation inhibitor RaiA
MRPKPPGNSSPAASAPRPAPDDRYLGEIDERLTTAGGLLESLGREWPDVAIDEACGHLIAAMRAAESAGLASVSTIASKIEGLLRTLTEARHASEPEIADAVLRGIEVVLIVARDAGRRRAAQPAAALDDAVEHAFARIARVSRIPALAQEPVTVTLRPTLAAIRAMAGDICSEIDKPVDLHISGEDVEVPAALAEAIVDPLAQLVRNSIHVAIEPIAARVRARKPRVGRIEISARLDRGYLVLEVSDDGAGIDLQTIRLRAEARGLTRGDAPLDPEVALALMLEPEAPMLAAGDTVRGRIAALNGFLDVYGEEGGTRTVMRVPLAGESGTPGSRRHR